MNIFDIGIILVLIMFFIVGIKHGVIKETVSLLATILIFVLSFAFKSVIGNILCMFLPFWELDGFVTLNIFIYQFLAFILVFIIMLSLYEVSLKISKFLQKIVNMTIILIIPSKILGGLVSLLKGYLILFIVFLLLLIPFGNLSLFKESKCVQYMLHDTPILSDHAKDFVEPVEEVLRLTKKVNRGKVNVNNANLEALDIMLKYKVVDKKTVESLIEVDKLEGIKDIDSVLKHY